MEIVNDTVKQKSVKYEDVREGSCFKFSKDGTDVLMKTDFEQDAVSLIDGEYLSDLCGDNVFPVNAEVHIIN